MQAVGGDYVRIGGIGREPVDGRIGFDRQRQFRPASTAVLSSMDRAALARNEVAVGDEDGIRVARLHRDAAAVGDVVALGEPGKAVQRPALAFVDAHPDAVGRGRQQFCRTALADRETVQVLVDDVFAEVRQPGPTVATVAAAEDTVDFDAGPDVVRIARVGHNVGDLGWAGEAFFDDIDPQLFPTPAAVPGTVDAGRFGAGENYLRIGGMPRHRPDLPALHRRRHQLPRHAVVFAAIQAHFGAGQNMMGVVRRYGQRANLDLARFGVKG